MALLNVCIIPRINAVEQKGRKLEDFEINTNVKKERSCEYNWNETNRMSNRTQQ